VTIATATVPGKISQFPVGSHDFITPLSDKAWDLDCTIHNGLHFALHKGCNGHVELIHIGRGDEHRYDVLLCEECGLRIPFPDFVENIGQLMNALRRPKPSF